MLVVSKGEFARMVQVSPGRVSQWIAEGKIGPDALQGEGRLAKIIVDRAMAQVRLRRDPGQAVGNGIATRLFDLPEAVAADQNRLPREPLALPIDRSDDVALQIQQERLESEKRKNRLASIDEAVKLGKLVPADDVRAEMMRLARQVDDENAAMLADFASAIAGRFAVQQRDVLHLLREIRNEKKAASARRASALVEDVPETVEVQVEVGSS